MCIHGWLFTLVPGIRIQILTLRSKCSYPGSSPQTLPIQISCIDSSPVRISLLYCWQVVELGGLDFFLVSVGCCWLRRSVPDLHPIPFVRKATVWIAFASLDLGHPTADHRLRLQSHLLWSTLCRTAGQPLSPYHAFAQGNLHGALTKCSC